LHVGERQSYDCWHSPVANSFKHSINFSWFCRPGQMVTGRRDVCGGAVTRPRGGAARYSTVLYCTVLYCTRHADRLAGRGGAQQQQLNSPLHSTVVFKHNGGAACFERHYCRVQYGAVQVVLLGCWVEAARLGTLGWAGTRMVNPLRKCPQTVCLSCATASPAPAARTWSGGAGPAGSSSCPRPNCPSPGHCSCRCRCHH